MNEYDSPGSTGAGSTDSGRETLLVAFESGYFEEPRDATRGEIAAESDSSQPTTGGLRPRRIERLIVPSLAENSERTD